MTKRESRFPAFLVSTIVHTLVLIVLALIARPTGLSVGSFLTARQGEPTEVLSLEQINLETQQLDHLHENAATQSVTIEVSKLIVESEALKPSQTTDQTLAEIDTQSNDLAGGGSWGSKSLRQLATGGGLAGRSPDQKKVLGAKYGATAQSEEAVEMALQYLAAHQRGDGSWSFDLSLAPCGGQCRHSKEGGEDPTPSTAATGLALLAFLGAGHTHVDNGPYTDNVKRGLYYLRAVATETQGGIDWQKGSMYGHGIALMAVAEAMAMSTAHPKPDAQEIKNHEFYELVYKGAAFTCNAQHQSGSWGYYPKSPGDLTLTGWQVLSLVAARRNKVPLHTYTLRDAKQFALSTCGDKAYWFGYKGPPGEPTTTAVGLSLMLYLGESPQYSELMVALTEMAERGPTLTNIYHDYYATLALHHSRHRDWQQWNEKLRNHLVTTQEKSGHEKGSWHFDDRWGNVGGRLYTTAMCALTLEVYYRYLPLYGPAEDFPLH